MPTAVATRPTMPTPGTRRSARRTVTQTTSYRESPTSDTDGSLPEVAPVATRITKRKRGAAAIIAQQDDDEYGLSILAAPASPSVSEISSDLSAADSDEPTLKIKKKKRSPKKKVRTAVKEETEAGVEDAADGGVKKKKTPKKRTLATADDGEGTSPVKKARKPRAPKEEPVYVIPDVEKKKSTFKGRLGTFVLLY
jgi:hypothetical protein